MDSDHPSESDLELYLLHRLPQYRIDALEEHLLLCSDCQALCEQLQSQIEAIQLAFRPLTNGVAL